MALGSHLGVLGALAAQIGADFEQMCIQIDVKARAVTTKSEFRESGESFAPVERNQGSEAYEHV